MREWIHEHVDPQHITWSPAEDFMLINLPVAKVEKILDTKYSVYRHTDGSTLTRTLEWKLPLHLHEHVSTVQPTTSFFRSQPQAFAVRDISNPETDEVPAKRSTDVEARTAVGSVCDTLNVTPLCIRTLYETIDYVPQVPGKNRIGVTNFDGEVTNRSDARMYFERYRPDAILAADHLKVISIANGTLSQFPKEHFGGGEGDLDLQTLIGTTYPTPLLSWSTGGSPPFTPDADHSTNGNEPYLTWVNYVLQQDSVPQIISNSYVDDEQTVPPSYAKAVCAQFAQLSARGVSIIVGAGDGGVSGLKPAPSCLSNVDGTHRFIPVFPASCPYVTTVGGTINFEPEIVAFDARYNYSSGGGFSNYFARPSYQDAAVKSYLAALGDDFAGLYNPSGRGYPDVAAISDNFTIIWNGTLIHSTGTSAAAPTVAGVFALLNDALIAAGKPTLGFLNPWLYKKGHAAFVDVTQGSALGCNTTGFPAREGWDAVSGFGTPRFSKLLKAVGL